jgi:hypothetical protein
LIVPLVRCQTSNKTVRSTTAESAFDQAVLGLEGSIVAESSIFHPENLTFTADATDYHGERNNRTFRGQIGYYAMEPDVQTTSNYLGELWIAIAEVSKGKYTWPSTFPTSYSASFYTCSLRNTSVITDVSFIDNIQTLHAIAIKEMDMATYDDDRVAGNETSANWALDNYQAFGDLLFDLLSGFAMVSEVEDSDIGWNWTTTMDQTVFGTAQNFAAMTAAWKDGGLEDSDTTRVKNLSAIIEEFSLNASWSLMAMPRYKWVSSYSNRK